MFAVAAAQIALQKHGEYPQNPQKPVLKIRAYCKILSMS